MQIYDQPTKVLMKDFAREELQPGQVFEKPLAVRWFAHRYPKIRPTTVQMHLEGMSVNNPIRRHHRNVKEGSGHDLFWKVGPGQFRLWDPQSDPIPRYAEQFSSVAAPEPEETRQSDSEAEDTISSEFAAERDLRNYLEKNLAALEPGLRLYEEEGLSGIEFPAGGRRIDILAVGADNGLVVVELKVSRGYDRVIGQIMRYMAWVKQNLAEGRPVRGIIVASEISEDLKLATSLASNVRLVEYELSFKLKPVAI